jgi:hypothetical protein
MPTLISSFSIVADELSSGKRKGRIVPCQPANGSQFSDRLVSHKNYRGFSYEENHLEEWIARVPSAIFGPCPVLLLASQNYIHLGAKIDLLFTDGAGRLYPVELKVRPCRNNNGVVPYASYDRQMKPYNSFPKTA